MKRVLFISCVAFVVSMCLSSCKVAKYIDYGLLTKNKEAVVDNNNFSVDYPFFSLRYSVNGRCRIENKSDSLMIIDLGSSYLAAGENIHRLYSNEITTVTNTSSSTSSSGASVGLGGIARALGAGRAVQTIANGVTVGGGNANTNVQTTSTYYQQEQYVFIPSHGIGTVECAVPGVPDFKGRAGEYQPGGSIEQIVSYSFDSAGVKFQTFHNEIVVEKVVVMKNNRTEAISPKKNRLITNEVSIGKTAGALVGGLGGYVVLIVGVLLPILLTL